LPLIIAPYLVIYHITLFNFSPQKKATHCAAFMLQNSCFVAFNNAASKWWVARLCCSRL